MHAFQRMTSALIVVILAACGGSASSPRDGALRLALSAVVVPGAAAGERYALQIDPDVVRAARPGDAIDLVLPRSGRVTMRVTFREEQLGAVSIAGELVGVSGSSARLTVSGRAVAGAVVVGTTEWTIRTTAQGTTIQDEAAAGIKALPPHPPENPGPLQKLLKVDPRAAPTAADFAMNLRKAATALSIANIDLLIVSDRSYQTLMGTEDAERADIASLVAMTNKALTDSKAFLQFRVTNYKRYTDSAATLSHETILSRMDASSAPYTGIWPAIVEAGADVTVAFSAFNTQKGTTCGLAGLGSLEQGGALSTARPGNGQASVSRGVRGNDTCADLTLAHELGHVLGAEHDRANTTTSAGAYPYSHGYGIPGVFGDIMSYVEPQLPFFSSPELIACAGRPCGTANDDSVRTFNNTSPLLAAAVDAQARLSGIYWDPAASGSGWVVDAANGRAIVTVFTYNDAGAATWMSGLATPCPSKPVAFCVGLDEYEGGQTLTGPYRASRVKRRASDAELTFSSGYPATLQVQMGAVTRRLQRFVFAQGGLDARPQEPGWTLPATYWNPAMPGTGIVMERQRDTIVATFFGYREDGSATWTTVNGRNWTGSGQFTSVELPFVSFTGGQTLTGPYVAPTVAPSSNTSALMQVDTGQLVIIQGGELRRSETWSRFLF